MADGDRYGPYPKPIDMGSHKIVHVADATELDGAAALGQVPVVAADALDTDHEDWGPLDDKLDVDASMRKPVIATGPTRQVQFGVIISPNPGLPPTPNGTSGDTSPGVRASGEFHTHSPGPGPDPETEGARLYSAVIPGPKKVQAKAILAPLQRWDDVDAVGFDYYGGFENISNGWSQTAPDTWETTVNRAMLSGELGGVEPFVGLRFAYLTNSSGSIAPAAKAAYGFYVVTRVGGPSEKAQFVRAYDADAAADFLTNKIVNCLGGVNWGGHTFLLSSADNPTLGTDAISFEDHGTASIYAARMKFGFGTAPDSPLWQQEGADYLWVYANDPGFKSIPCRWLGADGKPTGAPQAWDSFLVWAEYTPGDDYINESPFFGVYEFVVYWHGEGGSYLKMIRRVAEANTAAGLTNLVAGISGVGMFHQGEDIEQTAMIVTVDSTQTAWGSWQDAADSADTRNLLTAAQLGLASTDTVVIYGTIPPGGGLLFPFNFPVTRTGTPMLSTLPAGTEIMQAGSAWISPQEGWDIDADPGRAFVGFQLYRRPQVGDDVLLFEATSETPLTANPQTIQWRKTITEQVIAPTDLMDLGIRIESTYDRSIEVGFVINSVERNTWIQLSGVTFPIGGTDDHQALRRRDQDVADADPEKADPCHPWSALGPSGRKHTKLGDATLTGSGTVRRLVMPADCSVARLVPTTSEVIYGIDRTGFAVADPEVDTSDEIRIHVRATESYTVTFVHGAISTVGADAMLIDDTGKNMECSSVAVLRFVRDPDSAIWRLL